MHTKDNAQFHIIQAQGWVRKDDKFLLAQRSFKELQAPGVWSIPGGKVEGNVGLGVVEETLKKEIMEEVGIEIKNKPVYLGSDAFVRVDGAHVVGLCFLCDWQSGQARALEDTEQIKWFSLEELQNFKDTKPFLKSLINALTDFLLK
jgi:ADP-ribose pyrophosphatase YjhB (NUDIX family)